MVKLVVSRNDINEDVKRWPERETGRRMDGGQGRQMTDAYSVKSMNQGREITINITNLTTHYIVRQSFEQK